MDRALSWGVFRPVGHQIPQPFGNDIPARLLLCRMDSILAGVGYVRKVVFLMHSCLFVAPPRFNHKKRSMSYKAAYYETQIQVVSHG